MHEETRTALNNSSVVGDTFCFPSGVDVPPGRWDRIASSLTGKNLNYFTPDPLPDLLSRCRIPVNKWVLRPEETKNAGLMLVREAAKRPSTGQVDTKDALRLCEIYVGNFKWDTTEDMIGLARKIVPGLQGLREEMAYTGGPTGSTASHIYAPASTLPILLDSMTEGLCGQIDSTDPAIFTAIVGFFGAHAHPFLDGNGRWARAVALYGGVSHGNAMAAMINIAFQNVCLPELAEDIWPRCRSSGLRHYLERSLAFEQELTGLRGFKEAAQVYRHINCEFGKVFKSRATQKERTIQMYVNVEMPLAPMRECAGLSSRAFDGFVDRLIAGSCGLVGEEGGMLTIANLLDQVGVSVAAAKRHAIA